MATKTKIKSGDVAAGPLLCRGPQSQEIGKLLDDLTAIGKAKAPADARAAHANLGGLLSAARMVDGSDPLAAVRSAAKAVAKAKARNTEDTLAALFAAGDPIAARILDHASRTAPCGHDLRADIAADGQFDGEPYEYDCSACGAPHSYRRLEED